MVQWWELTIPAASTLLGAWSGSWWQSHTTERQLARQEREAKESRQFTAHREDQALWFKERRAAYAELGRTSHAFMLAAYAYWSSEEDREKAMDEFNAAGTEMRNAMISVQVIGSEQQAGVVKELDVEMGKLVREAPRSYEKFDSLRDRFLEQARGELRTT